MKNQVKKLFTMIELITSTALMLLIFLIIGFVLSTVATSDAGITSKLGEAIRANNFFSIIATDFEASFPVFNLGKDGNSAGADYVTISQLGTEDPAKTLPSQFSYSGPVEITLTAFGATHQEFLRCVSSVVKDGGLQNWNGIEKFMGDTRIDYSDKPTRYVSYGITGDSSYAGGNGLRERMVYRREFIMRGDVRKSRAQMSSSYTAADVIVDRDKSNYDQDISMQALLKSIWQVRTEIIEKDDMFDFKRVVLKVTVEFAQNDDTKLYGDPLKFARYPDADTDGNGINDRVEHSYTTVIVVNRSNLENL
ncbi:MAG: hypothetical protein COA79_03145 [Planctomycetota bacterium]|nr:MAG: hypothetical protein COA79_03145 [Planctomycetota bacterium]